LGNWRNNFAVSLSNIGATTKKTNYSRDVCGVEKIAIVLFKTINTTNRGCIA